MMVDASLRGSFLLPTQGLPRREALERPGERLGTRLVVMQQIDPNHVTSQTNRWFDHVRLISPRPTGGVRAMTQRPPLRQVAQFCFARKAEVLLSRESRSGASVSLSP